MTNIFKAFLVVLFVFADLVLSKYGCRQCKGTAVLKLSQYESIGNVASFFAENFNRCATGNDYLFDRVDKTDCQPECMRSDGPKCIQKGDPTLCLTYTYSLTIWRYCGNGGSVSLKRPTLCLIDLKGGPCQYLIDVQCTKSVNCQGNCDCKFCGCWMRDVVMRTLQFELQSVKIVLWKRFSKPIRIWEMDCRTFYSL